MGNSLPPYLQHINHNMHIIDSFLARIAPFICIGCGVEGKIVCDWCRPDIAEPLPERCFMCKELSRDSRTCDRCRRRFRAPNHVWVRTLYAYNGKALVEGLKFERKYAVSDTIGSLMCDTLPDLPKDTIVVHVPTASNRVRLRGYDHAQLIARRIAKSKNLSYAGILIRHGKSRQVGANRQDRLRQLDDAFEVKENKNDRHTPILLVDDVSTTGGTILSATKVLKDAGYKNVNAIVFAQRD